jgi:hypothetical protein
MWPNPEMERTMTTTAKANQAPVKSRPKRAATSGNPSPKVSSGKEASKLATAATANSIPAAAKLNGAGRVARGIQEFRVIDEEIDPEYLRSYLKDRKENPSLPVVDKQLSLRVCTELFVTPCIQGHC